MRVLTFAILFFLAFGCRKNSSPPDERTPGTLRVSGYLYSENFWNDHLKTDLNLLTDLNLAFINPDVDGKFHLNDDVHVLMSRVHEKGVRVYLSVGGAAAPEHLRDLLKDDKRSVLVNNLVELVEAYNFDGVDIDLEGSMIDENYAAFIYELAMQLVPKSKLLTAAVATWNGNVIHDSTLARFDYINVMAYDKTGPWEPANAGPHSSYEAAHSDAMYYIAESGIDAAKVLIGVPFYGYKFSNGSAVSMNYNEIITQYPDAENRDVVNVAGGGKIFYNGIPTIRRKVDLAHQLGAAGIMIWELNQDAGGDKSLSKAIGER